MVTTDWFPYGKGVTINKTYAHAPRSQKPGVEVGASCSMELS